MGTVLLLDDDALVARTVQAIVASSGFRLVACTTADAFFDLLDSGPDYVMVDLVMPDTDGVEVIRRLAERPAPPPVILYSGSAPDVLEAARRIACERRLEVLGALRKPFVPAALRDLLTGRDAAPSTEDRSQAAARAADLGTTAFALMPRRDAAGRLRGLELAPAGRAGSADIPSTARDAHTDIRRRAVREAIAWLGSVDARSDTTLSLDLGESDLLDVGVVDALCAHCAESGVETARIVVELPESQSVTTAASALDVLTRLSLAGFQLALDHFGTGHSSITHLARLPLSELKLDHSFVAAALESRSALAIVRTSIGLARNLGLRSAAVGVDDGEILQLLVSLGCDLMQGAAVGGVLHPAQAHRLVAACASAEARRTDPMGCAEHARDGADAARGTRAPAGAAGSAE